MIYHSQKRKEMGADPVLDMGADPVLDQTPY